jgi:tRNA(fMet)-specific endonuclease VapC
VTLPALLADTNILSYAHNQHTLWNVYHPILQGHAVLIAAQTVAELRYGAFRVGWGTRRTARLEALMAAYPVVYPNDAICTVWASVRADVERAGRNISSNDAWIAATALELGVPLVTHNARDFKTVKGLTIITQNPA